MASPIEEFLQQGHSEPPHAQPVSPFTYPVWPTTIPYSAFAPPGVDRDPLSTGAPYPAAQPETYPDMYKMLLDIKPGEISRGHPLGRGKAPRR